MCVTSRFITCLTKFFTLLSLKEMQNREASVKHEQPNKILYRVVWLTLLFIPKVHENEETRKSQQLLARLRDVNRDLTFQETAAVRVLVSVGFESEDIGPRRVVRLLGVVRNLWTERLVKHNQQQGRWSSEALLTSARSQDRRSGYVRGKLFPWSTGIGRCAPDVRVWTMHTGDVIWKDKSAIL